LETELESPSSKDDVGARRKKPATSAAAAPLEAILAQIEDGPRLARGDEACIEQLLKYRPNLIESYSGCEGCQSYLIRFRV